ncbi:MAG: SUMF1/EgtB/PvdO family nonheme iron enzyme [Chloroflexi bacterium]|nr:SUMF1/EgtB/PvdO family nonheme iron enzyme [Chloroflexota bacterium]
MSEPPRRPQVFICYAKEDSALARKLAADLASAGVDVWLDKDKLLMGDVYEEEIKKAVRESDAFVPLLRRGFDRIGFRQREVHWALESLKSQPPGKDFIIPFLVERCELPDWCRSVHAPLDLPVPTPVSEVLKAIAKHCMTGVFVGLPPAGPEEALSIYRRMYVTRLRQLPLLGMEVGASDPKAEQKPIDLNQVYINLDTTSAVSSTEYMQPLPALAATILNRRLVILGDPGSGKSTFLEHLGLCLALHGLEPTAGWLKRLPGWPEPDLIPVMVMLRDFARSLGDKEQKATPSLLWNFIVARLKEQNLELAAGPVHARLEGGQAIVLLDGLDEIPTMDQRTLVRDAVAAFAQRYDRSRMVVTCRTLSYQDPAWRLKDVAFELAPFDGEKVHKFISAWSTELAVTLGKEAASKMSVCLQEAVARPDLAELASNPLLLTVMALVHTHKGHLPVARALLYEDTVDLLLWRWEQRKLSVADEMPRLRQLLFEAGRTDVDVKRVLGRLAFEAHQEGCGTLADIAQARLHKALAKLHPQESLVWARNVTEVTQLRAGLLMERSPEVYTFLHRIFQEYLAGAHLAAQAHFATQASGLVAQGAFWRQVILLAVGRLVYLHGDVGKPLLLVAELCPSKTDDSELAWRRAWLAGDALLEIGTNRVGDSALGRDLLDRVRLRLAGLLRAGALSPVERAAAGNTLARLGDPRFNPDRWHLPDEPLLGFVQIPAGPFIMGSAKGTTAYENEQPRHMVALPGYYIARYPVTVAQFQSFVESTGFSLTDPTSLQGLPNHPITNITFYEAGAYCKWLTEKLKDWSDTPEPLGGLLRAGNWCITLPSEAEWEKAARGTDGRIFPWGETQDPQKANCTDAGVFSASGVGAFPGGASPYGCLDMGGNVWEMCNSVRRAYPYRGDDGREDDAATAPRSLRGGAWDVGYDYSLSAYRGAFEPGSRSNTVGFRVAVSAPSTPTLGPILTQLLTFFGRADFQTTRVAPDLGEILVRTSKWVTHSGYGDILVGFFAGDLNGDHLRYLEKRIDDSAASKEVAYAVYDGELSDDAFWQLGAYKMGPGLTIVPLKTSAICDALLSESVDCFQRLRAVEQQYLGRHVNFYDESTAILDPTRFFGRHREADEIMNRLKLCQHTGIFGLRKIGKTSLLLHLKRRLHREAVPTAYLGLQKPRISPAGLFTDIVRQIKYSAEALGVSSAPNCKLLTDCAGQDPGSMFRHDILALWKVAQKELRSPLFVLILDEAERLVPHPESGLEAYEKYDEFFAPIRDLSQIERCLVSVVAAERPTIREEFIGAPRLNTMLELYDERYLSCLSLDECSNMIVKIGKLMGIGYSSGSLERIFEETAGHPYIARQLCALVTKDGVAGPVSVQDVNGAIDATLDRLGEYLRGWWGNLSDFERIALNSTLGGSASLDSPGEVCALHRLSKLGVIRPTEKGGWEIAIGVVRRWLQKRKGV